MWIKPLPINQVNFRRNFLLCRTKAAIKLLIRTIQERKIQLDDPLHLPLQKANGYNRFAKSILGHSEFCWLCYPIPVSAVWEEGRKEGKDFSEGGVEVCPQNKSYLQFHKHVRDGWAFNARLVRIHCRCCNWLSAWFTMAAVMGLVISFQKALWNKWGEKSIHWSNSIC